jgi:uncharacterized protein (TIGR00369 family)
MLKQFITKRTITSIHKNINILGMDNNAGGKIIKNMTENISPFSQQLLNIQALSVDYGKLTTFLPFKQEFTGNPKIPSIHGGIIASLLDHTSGFAAWTTLPDTKHVLSTININVNYLLPAPCSGLIAEGSLIHAGNKIITADAKIYTEKEPEKLFAISRATFHINKIPEGVNINDWILK